MTSPSDTERFLSLVLGCRPFGCGVRYTLSPIDGASQESVGDR